ncbi:hypothetical protein J5X84_44010 [Streptosporangiaceae bacterium NEAU-GS5]|nr:hypothetical protein [Streptosporangiaceae bacterium NEAU-GS5]
MSQLGLIISVAGGIAATLLGVFLGSVLTRKTEVQQWSRDRQVEACLAIMSESNRTQFALRGLWRRGEKINWIPWNEALASLTLMAHVDLVEAALLIDESFWQCSRVMNRGDIRSEEAWERARNPIERARLDFVNTARRHITGRNAVPLARFVARTPLDLIQDGTAHERDKSFPTSSAIDPEKPSTRGHYEP